MNNRKEKESLNLQVSNHIHLKREVLYTVLLFLNLISCLLNVDNESTKKIEVDGL